MANDQFQARVSPEAFQALEESFAASGLPTKKEWMDQVAQILKLHMMKEIAPGHAKDVEELEMHLRRTSELFVHLIQQSAHQRHDDRTIHEVVVASMQSTIDTLKQEALDANQALNEAREEVTLLTEQREALHKQVVTFETMAEDQKKLIQSLERQVIELNSTISELKGFGDENKQLTKRIQELEADQRIKDSKIDELTGLIEKMKKEHEQAVSAHAQQLDRLAVSHNQELERLTERKDVEMRSAVLAVREECQQKLQELHENYVKQQQADAQTIAALREESDKRRRKVNEPKEEKPKKTGEK